MIISFLNQKGGVGKTTLSINVAACFALTKKRVLLIDADKQGSSTMWASLREDSPFQVVSLARDNMAKDALKMAEGYDVTIIDGPPHAEKIARSCIIASDIILLPIEPSGLSTWASDLTIRQIQEAMDYKESIKCGFVVNRKIGKTVIGRDIRMLAEKSGIPVLQAEINQRVAFAESLTMGKTIFEWDEAGSAAKEILTLTQEVLEYGIKENIHTAQTA